jgi:heat shock protein HslJ
MLKKQTITAMIVIVIALMIAGCGGGDTNDEPPPAATSEAVKKNLSTLRLAGTSWELESFGEPGALVPSEPDVRSTLNFIVDRYVGTGGCNFFLGVYNAEEDNLRIETPAKTVLRCPEPPGVMEQEATFISAFLSSTNYELADDKLYIYTVENQRLMTMLPAEQVPLEGTTWSLRFKFNDAELQPIIPETTVTVESDGETLTGNAGCNDYSAPLIREDGSVKVGEITVTEEVCESPESIMEQEADYLEALQSATSVEELAGALFLYNSDEAPILLYEVQ